jgi:hypothetical protein
MADFQPTNYGQKLQDAIIDALIKSPGRTAERLGQKAADTIVGYHRPIPEDLMAQGGKAVMDKAASDASEDVGNLMTFVPMAGEGIGLAAKELAPLAEKGFATAGREGYNLAGALSDALEPRLSKQMINHIPYDELGRRNGMIDDVAKAYKERVTIPSTTQASENIERKNAFNPESSVILDEKKMPNKKTIETIETGYESTEHARGQGHKLSKLTDDSVADALKGLNLSDKNNLETNINTIADKLGIDKIQARAIAQGKTWRSATLPSRIDEMGLEDIMDELKITRDRPSISMLKARMSELPSPGLQMARQHFRDMFPNRPQEVTDQMAAEFYVNQNRTPHIDGEGPGSPRLGQPADLPEPEQPRNFELEDLELDTTKKPKLPEQGDLLSHRPLPIESIEDVYDIPESFLGSEEVSAPGGRTTSEVYTIDRSHPEYFDNVKEFLRSKGKNPQEVEAYLKEHGYITEGGKNNGTLGAMRNPDFPPEKSGEGGGLPENYDKKDLADIIRRLGTPQSENPWNFDNMGPKIVETKRAKNMNVYDLSQPTSMNTMMIAGQSEESKAAKETLVQKFERLMRQKQIEDIRKRIEGMGNNPFNMGE